ncbi:IclR family transcriptional regulator [Actinomadura sp. NPDC049753]|uniref:IclR family transcriptional regulator n=1 Tax=Actinomadura sp. NPDC049753 TaxID=3154739 RepID=UPI00342123BD
MENKPPYPLQSVDNALHLLQLLRDQGGLRVSEAAAELGTARSTAHRLLAMLVYRGFAVQDANHTYLPGPALSASSLVGGPRMQRLRRTLLPHMEYLCDRVDESVNLMVRVGTQTRFLATVESHQALHVGDRQGTILPAHLSSGGRALLAELDDAQLAELYLSEEASPHAGPRPAGASTADGGARLSTTEFQRLLEGLRGVRKSGYALNLEATEAGICAIGKCVVDKTGRVVGALSIAAPMPRFPRDRIPHLAAELHTTVERARNDLDPHTM